MINIHDKEVNTIAECKLLHNIINPPKLAKILKSHYSPILRGCMNTRIGRAKFKVFCILLYIGCSSTIVIGIVVENIRIKEGDVLQWHTQARKKG